MVLRTVSLLVLINLVAALIAAAVLSTMFGILTESVTAGLTFPLAILSMAVEGDPWGVWIIGSLLLTIVWLLSSTLLRLRNVRKLSIS
jgi:hypothetical protein